LLDHVPPVVVLLSVIDEPTHTALAPVISATVGIGFTVMVYVALPVHPSAVVTVQVIADVPAATPVTTPLVAFTVATPVVSLVQLTLCAVTVDE
jgi:hypothetical protein